MRNLHHLYDALSIGLRVVDCFAIRSGTQARLQNVGLFVECKALSQDLKPGEYGFFMATGQQVNRTEGRGTGGAATGRIYDFSFPE